MATGSPDFNEQPSSNPTSPLFNQGEIPNRLLMGGGSNSQSGWWLWASGFENGVAEWESFTLSANKVLDKTRAHQGRASAKLLTTNVNNNEQLIQKTLFTSGKRYGIEAFIAFNDLTSHEIFIDTGGVNKNSGQQSYGRIVIAVLGAGSGNIYYENNGVRTLIQNIDNYIVAGIFHYVKLVIDVYENNYIRFYFDDLIFELNTPAYQSAGVGKYSIYRIWVKTKTAAIVSINIDNVIITAGEP